MTDNLFAIDSAMNSIKEEVSKELFECLSKQNRKSYYQQISPNNFSFSDKSLD